MLSMLRAFTPSVASAPPGDHVAVHSGHVTQGASVDNFCSPIQIGMKSTELDATHTGAVQ